jgi:hypothetical protein
MHSLIFPAIIGGTTPLGSAIEATNPVVWYDFQSDWSSTLKDVSGNDHHLTNSGMPAPSAALRSTTSQSLFLTGQRTIQFIDPLGVSAGSIAGDYFNGQENFTITFSLRHTALFGSSKNNKIFGMGTEDTGSNLRVGNWFYANDQVIGRVLVGSWMGATGGAMTINTTDIYSLRWRASDKNLAMFKNGVYTGGAASATTALAAATSGFGIGGDTTSGGGASENLDTYIDLLFINTTPLNPTLIGNVHTEYLAEVL